MTNVRIFLLILTLVAAPSAGAASPDEETRAANEAEIARMVEGAEAARMEAEKARIEAHRIAQGAAEQARRLREESRAHAERSRERSEAMALEHAQQEKEMERAREQLSKAHRELREAQREIARAHRDLSHSGNDAWAPRVFANLGDRPVIGVVMGKESAEGIELVAVSPGGPAEKAGLRAGDLMVKIGGMDLTGREAGAKAAVFEMMETTKAGDEIEIVVDRGDEVRAYGVVAEVREPASWQSLMRIPEMTTVHRIAGEPGEQQIIIERSLAPEIDEEALAERIEIIKQQLDENGEFPLPESLAELPHWKGEYEFVFEDFSDVADQAFDSANIWFGLPQAHGLELAKVNEGLGAYFNTDRGVLVLQAREDNAYRLQSGDVILKVAGKAVSSPPELMRALRSLEPGQELEIVIKRDGEDTSLNVVMPENRFGLR